MNGFPVLDLVVGTIFIYFLLSIICSAAIEMVLTMGKFRAKMLEEWLLVIFNKPITPGGKVKLGQAIMDHCSTTALSKEKKATAYIDAKNFTAALLEKVTYNPANPKSAAADIDQFITAIQNSTLLPSDLQGVLLGYAFEAKDTYKALTIRIEGEIELFKSKIEIWYDTNMDRVTEALKARYIRRFTFWIALIFTVSLNADSISIVKYLYKNPEARTQLVARGYAAANSDSVKKEVALLIARNTDTLFTPKSLQQLTDTLTAHIEEIKLTTAILDDAIPLGWNDHVFTDEKGVFCWQLILSKIAGLFVTILAIMMGAPFWFDVLNKISNLRGSGAKPASQTDSKRSK